MNFLFDNLAELQGYDAVEVYYDNGQHSIAESLHLAIECALSRDAVAHRSAQPSEYRLSQVADHICTMELPAIKCGIRFVQRKSNPLSGCRYDRPSPNTPGGVGPHQNLADCVTWSEGDLGRKGVTAVTGQEVTADFVEILTQLLVREIGAHRHRRRLFAAHTPQGAVHPTSSRPSDSS